MEIANVAIGGGGGECKGVAPEVPLEDGDGVGRAYSVDEG